jgi:hypothetical protein
VESRGTLAENYYRGFKRIENRGTYTTPIGDAAPIEARFGQGILATRSALDLDRPVRRVPAAMLAWLLSRPESSERISSLQTR